MSFNQKSRQSNERLKKWQNSYFSSRKRKWRTNLKKLRMFIQPGLNLRVLHLVVERGAGTPEPVPPTRHPVHCGLALGRVEVGPAPRNRRGWPLLRRGRLRGQLELIWGLGSKDYRFFKGALTPRAAAKHDLFFNNPPQPVIAKGVFTKAMWGWRFCWAMWFQFLGAYISNGISISNLCQGDRKFSMKLHRLAKLLAHIACVNEPFNEEVSNIEIPVVYKITMISMVNNHYAARQILKSNQIIKKWTIKSRKLRNRQIVTL